MAKRIPDLVIDNGKIIYRNFAGEGSKYNNKGKSNFCVIIEDPEQAQQLAADGWNVKIRKPLEEGDKPEHYIQVKINFDSRRPPKIYLVTKRRMTELDEDSIGLLDTADIVCADMTITGWPYDNVSGRSGVSAYLKTLYVTIAEDAHADKYSNYNVEDQLPYGMGN